MNLEAIIAFVAWADRVRPAMAGALNNEQQHFCLAQSVNLPEYLATDTGKAALQQFVSDWKAHVEKPS